MGNHFFGDKKVLIRENLLDYKPQNLLNLLSLVLIHVNTKLHNKIFHKKNRGIII
ncbi:hypothetical protein AN2V17_33520 [Vallitalea sp. AN17-2]|uniref:Uncharacterized protein n=1 Tax=Vallitalea maricola TaxID=3074433 RepID=A0ACB5UNK0_9FIRM|nr:hypothetical protein AN2V17_33520 [Vallitalea sp. AN17-2]